MTEQALTITGDTSDGYHTFNELYAYREAYNALLFNEWAALGKYDVHKSWRHSDGEWCFGGGWFIVVAQTPFGQVSNHYKTEKWDLFRVSERERGAEYDGHTPQQALERLQRTVASPAPTVAPRATAEEQQEQGETRVDESNLPRLPVTTAGTVATNSTTENDCVECVAKQYRIDALQESIDLGVGMLVHMRKDRDCEKRMRKDSDDLATTLAEIIRWALGEEGEFTPPPEDFFQRKYKPFYWWRGEMRKRFEAAMSPSVGRGSLSGEQATVSAPESIQSNELPSPHARTQDTEPDWQPIETCPQDWTWFLAWSADLGFLVWRSGPGLVAAEEPDPTHWQPLPLPPLAAPVQESMRVMFSGAATHESETRTRTRPAAGNRAEREG